MPWNCTSELFLQTPSYKYTHFMDFNLYLKETYYVEIYTIL